MKFSTHLIASIALAALLYPVFGTSSLFALIGGIFADTDHYLHFVFIKKKFNPFECNRYYAEEHKSTNYKEFDGILMVFHTIEFLVLMLVLSFYSKFALAFTIGLASHYIIDAIWFKYFVKRFVLNHSIIWWLAKKFQKQRKSLIF